MTRITVEMIADEVQVSVGTVHNIIQKHLRVQKIVCEICSQTIDAVFDENVT